MGKELDSFFELVRAGLWEKEARLAQYGDTDYSRFFSLLLSSL